MLTKEKIHHYEARLENMRAQLLREIQRYEKPESFGKDTEDEDEKTDEAEETGNRLAIAQAKKEELEEVEIAFAKIAKGTYGICDKCGGHISLEVFDVAPESALCENCKRAA